MASPKVYDWNTNQWMVVPEKDVTDGVAKGRYTFEEGIEVPAMAPDGQHVYLPSSQVQDAFGKGGYRWATNDDIKAWQERGNEAATQKAFGDRPGSAFVQGGLEGAVPGADYLMEGMGALVGKGGVVKDALKEQEDRNLGANLAGNLVGAVASPLVGAATAKAAQYGTRAGMAGAKALSLSEKAAEIASKAGAMGAEGVYFGTHDALNESALGDPSDVAETLAAGAGSGLMYGLAGGAAFEAAKVAASPLKKVFSGAIDRFSKLSDDATEALAKGVATATIPKAERAAINELIPEKAVREQMFVGGGREMLEKASGEIPVLEKQLAQEGKQLGRELKKSLATADNEMAANVNRAVEDAGGELYSASRNLFAEHQAEKLMLTSRLEQSAAPGAIFEKVDKDTDDIIKTLERYGDAKAKAKASELSTFVDAQKRQVGLPSRYDEHSAYEMMTAGREVEAAQQLRERALAGLDSLPEPLQKKVKGYVDNVTESLYAHPEFGADLQKLDRKYEAFQKLNNFVSEKAGGFTNDIVGKVKGDPEFAAEFDAIMKAFPDVAPHIQEFSKNLKDVQKAQVSLENIRQVIKDAGLRTNGKMGPDDFLEIAKAMGKDDIAQKADRLRKVQETLSTQDVGPISQYANMLHAMGRDVPEDLYKYEGNQKLLSKLHELTGRGVDDDMIKGIMTRFLRQPAKNMIMSAGTAALGGLVGNSVLDGPAGIAGGAIAGALVRRGLNPGQSLETLTRIQRAYNQSYKQVDKVVQSTVDALTSDKAFKKGYLPALAFTQDIAGRKDSLKARQDYLTKMQDPEALTREADRRIGMAEGAPNITAATHAQYARGLNFLATKVPADPMAHQSIMSNSTNWRPSDTEMAKFERYVQAVESPQAVLANVASGRVTPEEVETLKAVWPGLHKQLQERLTDAIMKPDLKLTYQQRINIGSLFEVPADVSLRPDFVARMQERFKNQKGEGPKGQGMANNPSVQFSADQYATPVDRATYK